MPAYILRYAGTKQLAGFYAADSVRKLFYLVDEYYDPYDYEFTVLHFGYGIEFHKTGDTIKYIIGAEEYASEALAKADHIYLTEGLSLALDDRAGQVWRRF